MSCWLTYVPVELTQTQRHVHRKMHTHTAHSAQLFRGFGVQRTFYFSNSSGLVTLHWWQTEEQVANIKHITSNTRCTNNTITNTLTDSHSCFLLSCFLEATHHKECGNIFFLCMRAEFCISSSKCLITALLTAVRSTTMLFFGLINMQCHCSGCWDYRR